MINNNLTPLALRFLKKERIYAKSIFYSSDYISNLFKSYKINEDSFYISFHLIYYIIDNKKNNMDIIYFYNQKFIKFINVVMYKKSREIDKSREILFRQ